MTLSTIFAWRALVRVVAGTPRAHGSAGASVKARMAAVVSGRDGAAAGSTVGAVGVRPSSSSTRATLYASSSSEAA